MKFDRKIIDLHEQKHELSCIPSAIEMILKLFGKIPLDYHGLQNVWQNKHDGNFSDFHEKVIEGVKFFQKFKPSEYPRGPLFPVNDLFSVIDEEIQAGRFVAISLSVNQDWHNYIIYEKNNADDYSAFTKFFNDTVTHYVKNVKTRVREMEGTDILVYRIHRCN